MKNLFAIFMITLIAGCVATHWNYFYPYCKVNPAKFHKNLPNDYEDCLNQFDTILTNEAISFFKNRDSTIASIEISETLGGLFINFWNLEYYRRRSSESRSGIYSNRFYKIPLVLKKFIKDSIHDPEAMVRILFSAYHKRLNNIDYNWETEIHKLQNYWIPAKPGEGWVSPLMNKRENEILVDYHFNQLELNDTVDILYRRPPRLFNKNSDWHYLTGLIQYKLPVHKAINVKLIDINSEFGEKYIVAKNDTISIGDTLTEYSKGWLKRGIYYFNYSTNKEYRQ